MCISGCKLELKAYAKVGQHQSSHTLQLNKKYNMQGLKYLTVCHSVHNMHMAEALKKYYTHIYF